MPRCRKPSPPARSPSAKACAALAHPAFPEALGEGLTQDGRPYYAMAFLPGTPLGAVAPLPPAQPTR